MKLGNRANRALWNVPVGLQLSLIYAVLFAAVLALLGWLLYAQLDGFLVQNTMDRLERITRPILVRPLSPDRDVLVPGGSREGIPTGPRGARRISAEQVGNVLVRELATSDVSVAVLDMQGETITASGTLSATAQDSQALLPANWQQAAGQTAIHWIDASHGPERQLMVLTPITLVDFTGTPQMGLYLLQAASLGAADAVLSQLRLYIFLGIVVGLVIGTVLGLALTRVVLKPLDRMVGTAEAIAAGDLTRRLRLPPGRNEVARLGSAFDHMVDRLGAVLDAQRRFIADASHELRTPLTSLEGLGEMLMIGADRGDPSVVQRTTRSMHRELSRLSRLVSDLLTLSRLDSAAPMRVVTVDLSHLAAEVAEQMAPLAEARDIRLAIPHEAPVLVNGDPDRLKQVAINLVDNALRYSPPGGEVALWAAADPRAREAHLAVQDTGPGIAPEDLPHVFDRFYRGDASRTRATGNTGLGLAIVKAIVQAHAGRIDVTSTPGSGARFTVTLPLVFAQVPLPPPVPAPQLTSPNGAGDPASQAAAPIVPRPITRED